MFELNCVEEGHESLDADFTADRETSQRHKASSKQRHEYNWLYLIHATLDALHLQMSC
jgi:hypothetical protein